MQKNQNLLQKIKHHQYFNFLYQSAADRLIDGLLGLKPNFSCVAADHPLFFNFAKNLDAYLNAEQQIQAHIFNDSNDSNDSNSANSAKLNERYFFYLDRIDQNFEKEWLSFSSLQKNNLKNLNPLAQKIWNDLPQDVKNILLEKKIPAKKQPLLEKISQIKNSISLAWQKNNAYPADFFNPHAIDFYTKNAPPIHLLFKNLSYVFCEKEVIATHLKEIKNALAPEALLMVSHWGPQTGFSLNQFLNQNLNEKKDDLQNLEASKPVADVNVDINVNADAEKTKEPPHASKHQNWLAKLGALDMHDLGDLLSQNYSNPVVHSKVLKIEYENPKALWLDLCMFETPFSSGDDLEAPENKTHLENGATQEDIAAYWQMHPFLEIELVTAHAWHMPKNSRALSDQNSIIQFQKK